jgi:uncharacterized protein YbjT (DUF2867 family)
MTKILVLGASGQIARLAIPMLAKRSNVVLTLFLRDDGKLDKAHARASRIVEGDVLDAEALQSAMAGQDVVYANLAGDVDKQAAAIIAAMNAAGVKKLIFVTSLGIYDEVPGKFGQWNRREIGASLPSYPKAADLIEASGLDYAILRPAWLTDEDEVDFETTERNEPFKGTEVSRTSVAALVSELALSTAPLGNRNLGINKPNTDGDKPAFA